MRGGALQHTAESYGGHRGHVSPHQPRLLTVTRERGEEGGRSGSTWTHREWNQRTGLRLPAPPRGLTHRQRDLQKKGLTSRWSLLIPRAGAAMAASPGPATMFGTPCTRCWKPRDQHRSTFTGLHGVPIKELSVHLVDKAGSGTTRATQLRLHSAATSTHCPHEAI